MAGNAINYSVLGAIGFEAAAELVAQSRCFHLAYGDLESVVARLTALADAPDAAPV